MIVDLHVLTVYRDLKSQLAGYGGKVLDVGCGQSPYQFLLPNNSTYTGIDIVDSKNFDYQNSSVVPFDGKVIPFGANEFDNLICTEVLEHVEDYAQLISEMHRVMKPGARGVVTVPWSARYHYIPYDFFRYTPSSLRKMFAAFSKQEIRERGSDVSAIAAKIIVLFARNLTAFSCWRVILIPFWLLLSPVLILTILVAHLSLCLNLGSKEDPLGYTVTFQK